MGVASVGKSAVGLGVLSVLPMAAALGDGRAPDPRSDLSRGQELFERHCSVCHGTEGRGDGRAAYLLYPAPRNFASGRFRLVSTKNGIPTQSDLIATIRRGMPGSAMPSWGWLAEEDLWNLALYVRHLSVEGQIADLLQWSKDQDEELSEDEAQEEAQEIVADRMIPGEEIHIDSAAPDDPVTLFEGRRSYLEKCASCHGENGTGDSAVNLSGELKNEDGTPNTARDFTIGILKGGTTPADIAHRILGGLPGSPMPATDFDDPTEAAALVAYVHSLIKPGAQERVLQRRRTVLVNRVAGKVPSEPDDPAWSRANGVWIALMPLWWRNERVEGVVVRALHDGETIAFRLSWRDASDNHDLLGPQSFSDSGAIEISVEKDPPLFAMGAKEHPVDIAFWRAAWEADLVKARDVHSEWPNMMSDSFSERVGDLAQQAISARAVGNTVALPARPSATEALTAQGFGTVGPRGGAPSSWSAKGAWKDGYWDVVFSRAMDARIKGEPGLSPGLSAFLAFAVWDGAFNDRNGQKSVSVWHRLEVTP